MSIRIRIPTYLHYLTHGKVVVDVKGSTVIQCLEDLIKQYPNFERLLFVDNDNRKLVNYIDIAINGESIRLDELAKPIKEGDELDIRLIMVIGG